MTPLSGRMLVLLVLAAAAWLVHLFGRVLPDWAVALAVLGLAAPITLGLARRGRLRCMAFRALYLQPEGWLGRRFRGGVLLNLRAGLAGIALAAILFTALVRLEEAVSWAVLVVGALATAGAFAAWQRALRSEINPRYLPETAWRLTFAVVGIGMAAALIALAFYRPYPDLGEVTLERAVWHFVDQEQARSTWAQWLLQMAGAKDGLRLWLAQQLMPQPGISAGQALGWAIVLAEEALFVWSYLSYLCPVLIGSTEND